MRMLPPWPNEHSTKSEREIFALIERAPNSEEYVCLHALGLSQHDSKEYGEGDFVIVGPLGVFCLEVKGGLVSRKDGLWTIGWSGKNYTSREGPFKQANSFRWSLAKDLENRTGWKVRDKVLFSWGVVFPDITFTETDPEWAPEQVYDERDKAMGFVEFLKGLAGYAAQKNYIEKGRKPPLNLGPVDIKRIVDELRPDFDLVPSMTGLMSESRRELLALDDEQYRALDFSLSEHNPRLICLGGAGTGKTVIAMEAARRLAATGLNVLFLCFNRFLARELQKISAEYKHGITVYAVHQYLRTVIEKAGLGPELRTAESTLAAHQLYGEAYPRIFDDAVLSLMEEEEYQPFDALVIDEAQDVLQHSMMNCLASSLEGSFQDGRWVLFLDPDLQADVYDKFDEHLLSAFKDFGPHTITLRDNYRNPPDVVRDVSSLVEIEPPNCRRDLVSPVEYVFHSTKNEEFKHLRALLIDLMRQKIEPRSVTILSPYKRDKTCLHGKDLDIGKEVIDFVDASVEQSAFTFSTVSAFKGLENDIIILMDLSLDGQAEWQKAVSYVGMTRAKTKLYVLLGSQYEQRIKSIHSEN